MFDIRNDDKTIVLIDGANMYATTKALGFDVDFAKFYAELEQSCNLLRICYYTALVEDENDRILLKPLVDWLAYNNYTMVTKPAKVITNSEGVRRIKGNMDVEIAVEALEYATAYQALGNIVICTGDGDFVALVKVLQKRGINVTIVSSIRSHPPMCADDLRKQADRFVDLEDIKELIEKKSHYSGSSKINPARLSDIQDATDNEILLDARSGGDVQDDNIQD